MSCWSFESILRCVTGVYYGWIDDCMIPILDFLIFYSLNYQFSIGFPKFLSVSSSNNDLFPKVRTYSDNNKSWWLKCIKCLMEWYCLVCSNHNLCISNGSSMGGSHTLFEIYCINENSNTRLFRWKSHRILRF